MEKVAELLVQAQSGQVRGLCSQALLQYLLDYPMSEKRLNGHLEFLIQNLEYRFPSGREAVLDTLGAVVQRFPREAVEAQSAFLFLPVAARLVNDPVPSCRTLAGTVLRLLLQRCGPAPADALLEFCEKWLAGAQPQLQRAAAQVLGLASECVAPRVERRLPQLAPILEQRLLAAREEDRAAAAEAAEAADDAEAAAALSGSGWQVSARVGVRTPVFNSTDPGISMLKLSSDRER